MRGDNILKLEFFAFTKSTVNFVLFVKNGEEKSIG